MLVDRSNYEWRLLLLSCIKTGQVKIVRNHQSNAMFYCYTFFVQLIFFLLAITHSAIIVVFSSSGVVLQFTKLLDLFTHYRISRTFCCPEFFSVFFSCTFYTFCTFLETMRNLLIILGAVMVSVAAWEERETTEAKPRRPFCHPCDPLDPLALCLSDSTCVPHFICEYG